MTQQVDDPVEEFLSHYGVLGMKWGVRRTAAQLKRARQERKNKRDSKLSADEKRKRALKKKKPSEMSNEEVKFLTERLNLEKRYSELRKAPVRSAIDNAKMAQEIFNVANSPVTKAGKEAIKKAWKNRSAN